MKKSFIYIFSISVSYLIISLSTTVLNKYILTILNFQVPFLLVVMQSFFICSILLSLKCCGMCRLCINNYKMWLIPSVFLCVMIFSGSKSLQYLDISFYTLVKNSSILIVAIVEYFLFKRFINLLEIVSFLLMIAASYINFFKNELYGNIWIIVNVVSTTIYIVSLRHIILLENRNVAESVFFPNLISFFLIGIISYVNERNSYTGIPNTVIVYIIISSICALLTSFTTAMVLACLSSTTYSMLGALNKVIMGFTGFIFINEKICYYKMLSLLIGMFGILLYTFNQNVKNINFVRKK